MSTLFIEEVGTHLASEMSRTVGQNLFYAHMPPEPADAISVVDNGGTCVPNTKTEHRSIQVIVRHPSYSAGANNALTAYTKLNKKSGMLTTKTAFSTANHLPAYLGMDEGGIHSWSINFTMTIKGAG